MDTCVGIYIYIHIEFTQIYKKHLGKWQAKTMANIPPSLRLSSESGFIALHDFGMLIYILIGICEWNSDGDGRIYWVYS